MEVELLEIEKIILLNFYAPNNIAWNTLKAKPNMRDRERQSQNYVGVYFSTLFPPVTNRASRKQISKTEIWVVWLTTLA